MNKKIKVIDLLNKIANGEEAPKWIRFHGLDFEFDELEREYSHNDNDLDMTMDGLKYSQLNDYAEILEDNTEEIAELDEDWTYIEGQIEKIWSESELELVNKINELVRAVNELRNKINKK